MSLQVLMFAKLKRNLALVSCI